MKRQKEIKELKMIDKLRSFFSSFVFIKRTRFQSFSYVKKTPYPEKLSRVAAVQVKFQIFKSVKEFHNGILNIVRKAKDKGAQLICFPERMNLELQPIPYNMMSDSQRLKISNMYSKVFKDIVVNEGVYISEAQRLDGKSVRTLWTPEGSDLSEEKVMSCVGKKVAFFDSKSKSKEGVQLVINPRWAHVWMSDYESFKGAWLLSQQKYVFSVESYMVGNFSGMQLVGKSGIYAPIEITDSRNGILALSKSETQGDVIIADLNFERLEKFVKTLENKGYDRLLLKKSRR